MGEDKSYKRLLEVWSEYDTTNNLELDIYINDEASPRTGNSPTFLSTTKNTLRSLREGSICRKVAIKGTHSSNGVNFNISEVGFNFILTKRPYGR